MNQETPLAQPARGARAGGKSVVCGLVPWLCWVLRAHGVGADARVLGEASTEKEPLQLDLKGQRDASWTRQRLSQLEGAA